MGDREKSGIQAFKKRLVDRFGNGVELILFGSVARGTATTDSDIDLLALLPVEVNNAIEEEVFSIAYDVELEFDIILGIIVYPLSFWRSPRAAAMPLHQNISREGVAL
ncbi:MAG: nucleotidyltransferase domain-containing protein [Spirochaetes bacterium]|nr:nucleotidyltransferase domain-containing protein [Spirochaetota bacterium]